LTVGEKQTSVPFPRYGMYPQVTDVGMRLHGGNRLSIAFELRSEHFWVWTQNQKMWENFMWVGRRWS